MDGEKNLSCKLITFFLFSFFFFFQQYQINLLLSLDKNKKKYNLSKEGTAMQVRSLENYIAALERTGSPGVEKMARAFRNQLLLIRNHYGSRLTHHWGLSGVSRTYQEMSQAVSNLLEDVKEVHDEANQPHQHLIDMDKKR